MKAFLDTVYPGIFSITILTQCTADTAASFSHLPLTVGGVLSV